MECGEVLSDGSKGGFMWRGMWYEFNMGYVVKFYVMGRERIM